MTPPEVRANSKSFLAVLCFFSFVDVAEICLLQMYRIGGILNIWTAIDQRVPSIFVSIWIAN